MNNQKALIKLEDPNDTIIEDDLSGEWKIQLTMQITFISSLDTREICTTDSKSDDVEIMKGSEADDTIKELFESFKKTHQEGLETKVKGSQFVFESANLLYYSLHKTSLNRNAESYIDFPSWIKHKGATLNPKNKDNECFKYAITVALNHERIKNDPQRISKIKSFIDQYEWKGIEFPSHSKDWKNFEQNNKTIALNILFAPYNTGEKNRACIQIKI